MECFSVHRVLFVSHNYKPRERFLSERGVMLCKILIFIWVFLRKTRLFSAQVFPLFP